MGRKTNTTTKEIRVNSIPPSLFNKFKDLARHYGSDHRALVRQLIREKVENTPPSVWQQIELEKLEC